MKLGYSVEGSTDRALLEGLRRRWCPLSEFVEGHFRGSTAQSRRREIPMICFELVKKGVECIVFLTDSNVEKWQDALEREERRCPAERRHMTVFGVCDRNVECWLAADADFIANWFKRPRQDFALDDPKFVVESAFGVASADKKESEIADFVAKAPLPQWLKNKSFEHFYDSLRRKSKELGCPLENLLEA